MPTDSFSVSGSDDERARQIRERAYQLWQSEGCPEGRDEEYWHRARELIEAEAQTAVPTDSVQIGPDLIALLREIEAAR